ncbi:hypothetical protein FOZ63_000600 [Perkinsus olseni]|uniref:Integrase catalytic domain-containing protein n=1 Tax=Perkinsus olseni TaxID=32597 RepID=A0A7J6QGI5_PEROL|nr:hypothetical protein FOZ63_000600 [Perkinsus olseni]
MAPPTEEEQDVEYYELSADQDMDWMLAKSPAEVRVIALEVLSADVDNMRVTTDFDITFAEFQRLIIRMVEELIEQQRNGADTTTERQPTLSSCLQLYVENILVPALLEGKKYRHTELREQPGNASPAADSAAPDLSSASTPQEQGNVELAEQAAREDDTNEPQTGPGQQQAPKLDVKRPVPFCTRSPSLGLSLEYTPSFGLVRQSEYATPRDSCTWWEQNALWNDDQLILKQPVKACVYDIRSAFTTLHAKSSLAELTAPFTDMIGRYAQSKRAVRLIIDDGLKEKWKELVTHCHDCLLHWHAPDELLESSSDLCWVLVCDTSPVATNATLWRVPRLDISRIRSKGDSVFSAEDFGTWQLATKDLILGTFPCADEKAYDKPHLVVCSDNTAALGRIIHGSVPPGASSMQQKRWTTWFTQISDLVMIPNEYIHIPGKGNWFCDLFSRLTSSDCDPRKEDCEEEIVLLGRPDESSFIPEAGFIGTRGQEEDSQLPTHIFEVPGADMLELPQELERHRKKISARGGKLIYAGKGGSRVYVPVGARSQLLQATHSKWHLSIPRMIETLHRSYWWPSLDDDVRSFGQACLSCARVDAINACALPRSGLLAIGDPDPNSPDLWQSVCLDHAGPFTLKTDTGSQKWYALIIIDLHSGFCEISGVPGVSASQTIREFFSAWASRYGWPRAIRCDNAPCFRAEATRRVWEDHGVTVTFSPPYWPRGNGACEAVVKKIKAVVKRCPPVTVDDLRLCCAAARAAHNSARPDGVDFSPAEFLHIPDDKHMQLVQRYLHQKGKVRERKREQANRRARRFRTSTYEDISVGDKAFVVRRKGITSESLGPYEIERISGGLAWVKGLPGPVARAQLVKFNGDTTDTSISTPPAMEEDIDHLRPGVWVGWEVIEDDGLVCSLDIGQIQSISKKKNHVGDLVINRASRLATGEMTMRGAKKVLVKKEDVRFSGDWLKPPLTNNAVNRLETYGYDCTN